MAGWGWLAGGRGKEVDTVLSNIPLQGLYTKKVDYKNNALVMSAEN